MSDSKSEKVPASSAATAPRPRPTARVPHLTTGQALHEDDDAVLGHPGAKEAHAVTPPVVSTGHALILPVLP